MGGGFGARLYSIVAVGGHRRETSGFVFSARIVVCLCYTASIDAFDISGFILCLILCTCCEIVLHLAGAAQSRRATPFELRLHDIICCQTGCETRLTTGWMFVWTVVQYNTTTGCQTRCQTGLATGRATGCIVCTNIQPVCTGCQTGLTTGCIVYCKRGIRITRRRCLAHMDCVVGDIFESVSSEIRARTAGRKKRLFLRQITFSKFLLFWKVGTYWTWSLFGRCLTVPTDPHDLIVKNSGWS